MSNQDDHSKPKLNGKSAPESSSPIEFPCDFIVKVIGNNETSFKELVLGIVEKHFPDYQSELVTSRPSKDDNYLAITITVHAKNKEELDALYQELTHCQEVLIAL